MNEPGLIGGNRGSRYDPAAALLPSNRILIASTTRWPSSARMAIAFAGLACEVAAIYPRGNPLAKTAALRRSFIYRATSPLRSLKAAIDSFSPELIVPCDDRVVGDLHCLYATAVRADDAPMMTLIERSLGAPHSYEITDTRIKFLEMASEEGILIPDSGAIGGREDLSEWSRSRPFPWILKCDRSWSGTGVRVATNLIEACQHFQDLSSPISTKRFLKRLLVDSDSFSILDYFSRRVPPVIAQQFIHGKPANIAVACWKGEVLAASSAVVLAVAGDYGASTVAQIIENPQMRVAAERLVQRLHLSGFVGFDFVIEEPSGDSYLIEMNPRFSHLAILRLGPGCDLVGALSARLSGKSLAPTPPVTTKDTIAFFPQAWLIDPRDPYIQTSYHDVPWEDPELVRELIKIPWARRRLLSRFYHLTVGK